MGAFTYQWDYFNADGNPAGYVRRFDKPDGTKEIIPYFKPDGRGGFTAGALPENRPLYGLLGALQGGSEPIFIAEGEKCAAALQGLGFTAVCSLGGSNAPHLTDWAPVTRHEGPIYLLPDNDEAGEKYGRDVAALVNSPRLRVVRLPNLPAKGDVVDWLLPFAAGWDGFSPLKDRLGEEEVEGIRRLLLDECAKGKVPEQPPAIACDNAIEEPLPLVPDLPEAAAYPVEELGPYLHPVAVAVQNKVGAPLALCAQSVLAAATLAVQAHADIELPNGSRRPVSNFFLTLADSGERKSSCDAVVLVPVREREKELEAQRQSQLTTYRNAAESYEQARKMALNEKNKLKRDEELYRLGPPPEAPLEAMLTCTEPTFEGLTHLLDTGQPSVGIFSSEGGQFFGGHGMSEDNRLRSIAGYSNLWDGDAIRRVRRGDGSKLLDGRRLSAHLMMQPEVAKPFLSNELLMEQGFFSRFLLCAPASTMGSRWYREVGEYCVATLERYNQHMLTIMRTPLPLAEGTRNTLCPRLLRMDNQAKALWITFYNECEGHLSAQGAYADIRGFANKLPEQALRLAGVLALVADIQALTIGEKDMERGITLARHYAGEALRMAEARMLDTTTMYAERTRKWLLERWPHEAISVPDLQHGVPFSYLRSNAERCKKVIAILCQHHWLIPLPEGAIIDGRKRRDAWHIQHPQSQNRNLSQGSQ